MKIAGTNKRKVKNIIGSKVKKHLAARQMEEEK